MSKPMTYRISGRMATEHGMALISALLLLLVMTIMAVGMFRSFGIQDKIAGNTREKQRSLHAAESAQAYAEWWLTANNGVNTLNTKVNCNKQVSADLGQTQICTNALANPADPTSWANAGNTYTPPGLNVGSGGVDTYYNTPNFNITFLYQPAYDSLHKTQTSFYQVDALGYGGSSNSPSVVESLFEVNVTYGATKSGRDGGYQDLGGP